MGISSTSSAVLKNARHFDREATFTRVQGAGRNEPVIAIDERKVMICAWSRP